MKKSQIQKIIVEELGNVLVEKSKAVLKKLKDAVKFGKNAGEVNNATKLLLKYGVKAKDIPKPQGLKGAAKSTAVAKVAPKTSTAIAKTADKATDIVKATDKTAKTAKTAKKAKTAKGPEGPVSGVAGQIRPGMTVPLTGVGSRVFKGRSLDDIAKELNMAAPMSGKYRNVDFFLAKALGKRRKLGLQNPAIAIPPRPNLPVPVPGTPPWKPWVMSDKASKWLKYAGLTAAAAALLGATSMLTPDEENIIPGPTPTPVPPPEPTPGPGPGPNAEACKTARGVRNLLKKKAEELTGKKGVAALRAIPLKGDDNSWIRDSYRKLWSARKSRSQSEKARLLIVAAWGEDLGCTVADAEDGPGDMITPLTPDVAPDMTPDLDIDPTLKPLPAGAEQTFEEPPEVREDERTKRFKEVYQKRRAMARRAIAKRNKLTDQYVKSYVGRPLRQGETLESWFESQGSKLPAGYTQKVNQYKQFEKKAMAGTANLVVRKLIPALKKLNPNLSKRQLKAFIDDKPITGTGESPADLPQRGQRDTATMGLTAAERAKLDMTGGPPPLQESKQLDRMKLLAGIRNENK